MARLGPADGGGGEVVARIRDRRGGRVTALDEMLLHSEPLADGWNTFLGAVRSRFELAADLHELAICRVAVLNGAEYEWRAHEPLLRAAGFPAEHLPLLRTEDVAGLAHLHHLVVAYTDAMTRWVQVPGELFAEVLDRLGERSTVELTATVAAYNMVSRFLVALEVGQEDR